MYQTLPWKVLLLPRFCGSGRMSRELRKSKNGFIAERLCPFKLTGAVHMDVSDGAGTLLMDVVKKDWSEGLLENWDSPGRFYHL